MFDREMYPHIVEAIADAAVCDYASALALRAVCRDFRAKADAALCRHLRFEDDPCDPKWDVDGVPGVLRFPGPLRVFTASGHRVPQLYPSSSLPLQLRRPAPERRKWPELARALEHTRLVDFHTTSDATRWLPAHIDKVRYIGIDDISTYYGFHTCRRSVFMQVIGVERTNSDGDRERWDEFWREGVVMNWLERAVVNTFLPRHGGGLNIPLGLYVNPDNGNKLCSDLQDAPGDVDPVESRMAKAETDEVDPERDFAFIFRPVDTRVASAPASTCRPVPDLGALFPVAQLITDVSFLGHFTFVGLEDVPWDRIGVPDPGPEVTKEEWLRDMVYELEEPLIGTERGTFPMEKIQARVECISLAEYRARVGEEEFATDMIPLDGLLDQFAIPETSEGEGGPGNSDGEDEGEDEGEGDNNSA